MAESLTVLGWFLSFALALCFDARWFKLTTLRTDRWKYGKLEGVVAADERVYNTDTVVENS